MKNCFCPYGVCARERGYMPLTEKNLMCKQKIVVPRHEPTINHVALNKCQWGHECVCLTHCESFLRPLKHLMEPIEDES
jgi:hypothetical protein